MNIASNPPSRAFHPGVIMSAVSAGNAISITEESNDSAFRIDEFSSLTGPFTKSTTPLKTVTQHPMYSGKYFMLMFYHIFIDVIVTLSLIMHLFSTKYIERISVETNILSIPLISPVNNLHSH